LIAVFPYAVKKAGSQHPTINKQRSALLDIREKYRLALTVDDG
jgi:hypothetical protein